MLSPLSLCHPAGSTITMGIVQHKHSSLRLGLIFTIIAAFVGLRPMVANATTVNVTVGNGGFFFSPSSVTIHPGDKVHWTWSSSGHSSTSGTPGMPNGLWDSTVLNQGAAF